MFPSLGPQGRQVRKLYHSIQRLAVCDHDVQVLLHETLLLFLFLSLTHSNCLCLLFIIMCIILSCMYNSMSFQRASAGPGAAVLQRPACQSSMCCGEGVQMMKTR